MLDGVVVLILLSLSIQQEQYNFCPFKQNVLINHDMLSKFHIVSQVDWGGMYSGPCPRLR